MATPVQMSKRNTAIIRRVANGTFRCEVTEGKRPWTRVFTMTRKGMIALAKAMLREAETDGN